MEYANEQHITLDIISKNGDGKNSLQLSIDNKNIEITKLLIMCAYQHHIILKTDEKDEDE